MGAHVLQAAAAFPMASGDEREDQQLSGDQKKEIAKWFLANAPAGEIQYVAKGSVFLPPRIISGFYFSSGHPFYSAAQLFDQFSLTILHTKLLRPMRSLFTINLILFRLRCPIAVAM